MPRVRDLSRFYDVFKQNSSWLVGQVSSTHPNNTAKIRVVRMSLDDYLLRYFNYRKDYWVYDASKLAKEGDIVLIKELPEQKTKLVTHEIKEVMYKIGEVVDPCTGRRCIGPQFADDLEAPGKKYSIPDFSKESSV